MTDYIFLSVLWILWCVIHSLLIADSIQDFFKKRLKDSFRYFRILYNMFALISFGLVYLYGKNIPDEILFSWSATTALIPIIVSISGMWFLYIGAKSYNMRRFFGFTQLNNPEKDTEFKTEGLLRYSRHPWYFGGYLLIWTGFVHLTVERLIVNIIFSVYLYVGTLLEEKKLVKKFGEAYRNYQKEVPMYIPFGIFKK